MSSAVPQPVLNLAREYRETVDPRLRERLKERAYRALVEARVTDIEAMVRMKQEAFEGAR